MIYKIQPSQILELLSKPETGMGYQVIEATQSFTYVKRELIVLNAQLAVTRGHREARDIAMIMNMGFEKARKKASLFLFHDIRVLSKAEFLGTVNEPNIKEKGAKENSEEYASGFEIFVRLSAFEDDLRIDKVNKQLLPQSYTTTEEDYKACKAFLDDPVERYALPNEEKIEWAFYIVPKNTDTLQRGTVQPANGKRGGGKEVYFEKGTSSGTFVKQEPY